MSAYVCSKNATFSSVVDLLSRHETIEDKNLLVQRLYMLNVESVNQRYKLKGSDRPDNVKEYEKYLSILNSGELRTDRPPRHSTHCCRQMLDVLIL